MSSHKLIPSENSQNLIVAVGDNFQRNSIVEQIKNEGNSNFHFPALIHPQACVSPLAMISEGSIVMGGANIGPFASVGRFSILNSNASLDHDSKLGEFSSLAPGAITGGNVVIGSRVAICLGSVVSNSVEIGDDVVVGANSFVKTNLKSNILVFGSPAKIIRERKPSDPYL
jgi:sugar O-acyltransferase (sialic acid O-acetyltransferase NeuD family)